MAPPVNYTAPAAFCRKLEELLFIFITLIYTHPESQIDPAKLPKSCLCCMNGITEHG